MATVKPSKFRSGVRGEGVRCISVDSEELLRINCGVGGFEVEVAVE
jgi:hypothetical protein